MLLSRLGAALRRLVRAPDAAEELHPLLGADLRVVVGLGNPGAQYAETRHNVGFLCVERLAQRVGAPWRASAALTGELAVGRLDERPLALVKPRTFMNVSGRTLAALAELGVPPRQVLVVYDDWDLPLGTLRLRARGSAGTHNGMRSILGSLGTEDIPRLRIGIGAAQPGTGRDHVLSAFDEREVPLVQQALERAADAAATWAREGAERAMSRHNR